MNAEIKQGDLLPELVATLADADGPVDLAAASSVRFRMRRIGGGTLTVDADAKIDQAGDGTDGSRGKVRYTWAAGETADPGRYHAEFVVAFTGKELTFPNDSYLVVTILAGIE